MIVSDAMRWASPILAGKGDHVWKRFRAFLVWFIVGFRAPLVFNVLGFDLEEKLKSAKFEMLNIPRGGSFGSIYALESSRQE